LRRFGTVDLVPGIQGRRALAKLSSDLFQELRVGGKRPSLPEGKRIYAIGDIHGRVDLLEALLFRIKVDLARRPNPKPVYVFLGDYFDRGAASKETIDMLLGHAEAHDCIFLQGNHEAMARNCLRDRGGFDQWLRLGGITTLRSYGVPAEILSRNRSAELQAEFHDALPRTHFRFLRGLLNFFSCGDFYFVHAGVNPNADLSRQREKDLLWVREVFLSSDRDFGKIIVHGHTPRAQIEVRPNRINIDTGAFATGILTCIAIDDQAFAVIDTAAEA
jgi:serine/threonine protein phosphatase 1